MNRFYRELCELETFIERYEYLRLGGSVGKSTFGRDRYINQYVYHSALWRSVRDEIIIRDEGCDLGVPGYEIIDRLVVHHINPLSLAMIHRGDDWIFDPDNLICTSYNTHQAIHFGDERLLPKPIVVRHPGDQTLW